jgi:hypothetical protein
MHASTHVRVGELTSIVAWKLWLCRPACMKYIYVRIYACVDVHMCVCVCTFDVSLLAQMLVVHMFESTYIHTYVHRHE